MPDDGNDQRQNANDEQRENELLAERDRGGQLGLGRPRRTPDPAEQLAGDLDEALLPAALLGAEILDLLRQLSDHVRLHQEHAGPAVEIGP